jgi:poly(3-hydroxybutyrate) depolymerase
VDDAFDFAAKLLESQRRFAKELFAAAAPVTSKATEKPASTKPRPVAATKKSA